MPVLVGVPVQERDVLRRHLDEAGADLRQAPREQASQPEAANHLLLVLGAEAVLRGAELLAGLVAGHVPAKGVDRLLREIEGARRGRAQQAMRVVVRPQQGLALVVAAVLADRALLEQAAIEAVPVLEARRGHAARRAHAVGGLVWEGDAERAVLAAEEAGGREGLQLLALADVEALSDVDERRHGGVARAERAGDDRAEVRRGDRLRRRVARVPMVLVPRVEDEAEIACPVGADERPAIDDGAQALEPCRELDVIDGGVDRGEGAEHLIGLQAARERRVALRVERLRVGHAAGHPQDDERVGGGRGPLGGRLRVDAPGRSRSQRRQGGCAGGREEVSAGAAAHGAPQRINWNSGSMTMAQSRSSTPLTAGAGPRSSRPRACSSREAGRERARV